ncbi:MAG: sugar transferase, partial [Lachnospiraceae bacterium]|nr:sugar transferase [Lachnospiraceae bacterium]
MLRKSATGLMKHVDFILLDLILMQVCFVIAYWIFHGFENPYANDAFQYQAAVLAAAQLVVIIFLGNYSGILKRGRI